METEDTKATKNISEILHKYLFNYPYQINL